MTVRAPPRPLRIRRIALSAARLQRLLSEMPAQPQEGDVTSPSTRKTVLVVGSGVLGGLLTDMLATSELLLRRAG